MFTQLIISQFLWEILSKALPWLILAITIKILINKIPSQRNRNKKSGKNTKETDRRKGREFEEYIGEALEMENWEIDYNGINKGKKDGGIDLIGKRGSETSLIQCKYRSDENQKHHENEINQLSGALKAYEHDHPNEKTKATFITTGQFSPEAKRIAKIHKIELVDKYTIKLHFKPTV